MDNFWTHDQDGLWILRKKDRTPVGCVSEDKLMYKGVIFENKSQVDVGRYYSVANAQAALPNNAVRWFDNTDHDIHVHKPAALAELLLETAQNGFWNSCGDQ